MSKEILVYEIKEVAFTDSLVISKGCEVTHKATIQLIRKYEKELNIFGPLTFEMRVVIRRQGGGTQPEIALLNEEQAAFIISMSKNTEPVIAFKLRLIIEFFRMKRALANLKTMRVSPEWLEARQSGKLLRLAQTDIIQEFVDYAKKQGSGTPDWYFKAYTTGIYKALFILDEGIKEKGLREKLNTLQLTNLAVAERVAQTAIREGMNLEMFYKDIYKFAIGKTEDFVRLIGGKDTVIDSNVKSIKRETNGV